MKRWLFGAIALAVMAAQAAASPRPPDAFYERMDELVAWIGDNSAYPGEVERYPAVVFLPPDVLNYLYYEGANGVPYNGQDEVQAVYMEGMMFLAETFDLGEDDHVLLHELVHHLQFEAERQFDCKADQEREAYDLQVKFVEEMGKGEVPSKLFLALLQCDIYG